MLDAGAGFEILAREDFSDITYSLVVHHPLMAKAAKPGQFVIVMTHETGERIPLTIADFDRDKGTVTLVVQAVGKSTKEMQQICQAGSLALRPGRADGRAEPARRARRKSSASAAAWASRRSTRRRAASRKTAPT